MSEVEREGREALHAYYDGELRGLARWRFARRLRRSPELQRELRALRRLGEWVRGSEAEAPAPDLWQGIERRLPALDALREQEREGAALASWLRPLGAAAVAAAALLAVVWGVWSGPEASGGVVRWMDSGGRPVLLLENDAQSQTTIIWLLEGGREEAARGGVRETA